MAKAKTKTKSEDIRTLSDDQIEEQILALKKEKFNLRFQRATNQLEKPSRVREVRRTIARLKTAQNQKKTKESK